MPLTRLMNSTYGGHQLIQRIVFRKPFDFSSSGQTNSIRGSGLGILPFSSTIQAVHYDENNHFYVDKFLGLSSNPPENNMVSDGSTRFPLTSPYSVQRKSVHAPESSSLQGNIIDIQKQEALTSSEPSLQNAITNTQNTAESGSDKPKAETISPDDLVDRVWRKLMRKLAHEQERTSGSQRWAR